MCSHAISNDAEADVGKKKLLSMIHMLDDIVRINVNKWDVHKELYDMLKAL